MSYLHRNGEITKFYPEDLVKNDCDLSVETEYEFQLLDEKGQIVATEAFPSYPNEGSIKWCFLKHKDKRYCKANVKKIYVPHWD